MRGAHDCARVSGVAGGLLDGRYRLDQVLGRGGMAVVWRADDQRLGRSVAVKVIDRAELDDPSALARFDREARIVASLTHPNIVTVHDVGVEDGVPYLVMELVTGRSLADRLTKGAMPVDEAVRIAGQVCAALDAAHAAGIVHRDVKPANILMAPIGAVKVCDFGIAHGPDGAWSRAGTATGTSEYMAPEQVAGSAGDHRADLYALGCVMYAMLTGQPPFYGGTPQQVGWQHLHDTATPLASRRADLVPELSELVDQLLSKDPAARPASAADVLARLPRSSGHRMPADRALTVAASHDGPIRGSAVVMPRTQMMPALDYAAEPQIARERGIRLSPALTAALAVVVIALVVLTVVALTRGRPETRAGGPTTTPPAAASSGPSAPASPTFSAPPISTPKQSLGAIQAALQAQEQAQQLGGGTANDLSHQLNDIERQLNHDGGKKAADKVNELRNMLASALDDGKITQVGYDAVSPLVDQLAAILPAKSDHDQG